MRRAFLNGQSVEIVRSFGDDIFDALKSLKAREQFAIIMRYGLSRQDPRTYKDIAAALGVSIARAQTIERAGLSKLRHVQMKKTAPLSAP